MRKAIFSRILASECCILASQAFPASVDTPEICYTQIMADRWLALELKQPSWGEALL
jgi:hypothetical protein